MEGPREVQSGSAGVVWVLLAVLITMACLLAGIAALVRFGG